MDGCEGDAITHFDLYNYTLIQLTDLKNIENPIVLLTDHLNN